MNKIETLARAMAANSSEVEVRLSFPRSYETFPERRITAVITWSDDELDQQTFAFTMDEYRQALVLAANTGPAPAAAQKPLRRGDLVEFCGGIWVVFSEDAYGEYGIATLTGDSNYYYADIDELTRIGSIRKKVKRLKASHCQSRRRGRGIEANRNGRAFGICASRFRKRSRECWLQS